MGHFVERDKRTKRKGKKSNISYLYLVRAYQRQLCSLVALRGSRRPELLGGGEGARLFHKGIR
jgi:hypothetical protein